MDLEIIILNEVTVRQIPYDITYMWNLKYDTNNCTKQTHREQTCGCQGGGMDLGVWNSDVNYYT